MKKTKIGLEKSGLVEMKGGKIRLDISQGGWQKTAAEERV